MLFITHTDPYVLRRGYHLQYKELRATRPYNVQATQCRILRGHLVSCIEQRKQLDDMQDKNLWHGAVATIQKALHPGKGL